MLRNVGILLSVNLIHNLHVFYTVGIVLQKATLDGLVVSISAFGTEGRGFESTKGYTPDSDMCARRQVCSCHTVSLDIGLSHIKPGIIHDDAHTIALPSVCRCRLVIIAKVVEDVLA